MAKAARIQAQADWKETFHNKLRSVGSSVRKFLYSCVSQTAATSVEDRQPTPYPRRQLDPHKQHTTRRPTVIHARPVKPKPRASSPIYPERKQLVTSHQVRVPLASSSPYSHSPSSTLSRCTSSTPPRNSPPARPRVVRPPPPVMSDDRLSPYVLAELLGKLDETLEHVPYAVCGLAALCAWGLTSKRPTRVSIICPSHSAEVVKCWAATNLAVVDPRLRDVIGIETSDGVFRKVRIKFVRPTEFEALRVVSLPLPLTMPHAQSGFKGLAAPRVLALCSLLNQCALAWVTDKRAMKVKAARESIASDIFWILERIINDGGVTPGAEPITALTIPKVVDPPFWDVFRPQYKGSEEMFVRAGLVISKWAYTTTRHRPAAVPMPASLLFEQKSGSDIATASAKPLPPIPPIPSIPRQPTLRGDSRRQKYDATPAPPAKNFIMTKPKGLDPRLKPSIAGPLANIFRRAGYDANGNPL